CDFLFFFFQAEDGIRDYKVTGVQTCALPIFREGDKFLYRTFQAVANGPNWATTVFIVNFDEWGGFFEHVAPPRATAGNQVDTDIVDGKTLLGFRVPTVIASPFAKGGPSNPQVNHLVFDHTSVLKLIEWRWRLMPL